MKFEEDKKTRAQEFWDFFLKFTSLFILFFVTVYSICILVAYFTITDGRIIGAFIAGLFIAYPIQSLILAYFLTTLKVDYETKLHRAMLEKQDKKL